MFAPTTPRPPLVLCAKEQSASGPAPVFAGRTPKGEGGLDEQPPGPGQLFQIRRPKKNLLISFAVQLGPCGIAAQTLPALCYTTHKVAERGSKWVKESEGVSG